MTGVRAKKALGQNFLVDGNVVNNIVRAADIGAGDHVLEVGPGQGALTGRLAAMAERLVAVEWDRDLVPLLQNQFVGQAAVSIVHGDILRTDLTSLLQPFGAGRWKVVANLPYNISSQVLFTFMENRALFSQMVLMLQKEVGDRLVAPPSCKDYGVLTVLCRQYFDIEKVFLVKPTSFRPIPKVDSLVLRFRVLPEPRVAVGDEKLLRSLVKAAFGQRRKTLANCLKSMKLFTDPAKLETLFAAAALDGGRRGETLSLEDFARLTNEALLMQRCVS
jgi:16S rRNA (adenine1518-N6/adenine1519-N6)-dimethyltransferase